MSEREGRPLHLLRLRRRDRRQGDRGRFPSSAPKRLAFARMSASFKSRLENALQPCRRHFFVLHWKQS